MSYWDVFIAIGTIIALSSLLGWFAWAALMDP